MKILFTAIAFFLSVMFLSAQVETVDVHEPHTNHKNNFVTKESLEKKVEMVLIDHELGSRIVNGTIWVKDSSIYYDIWSNVWVEQNRWKVLERDEYGNNCSAIMMSHGEKTDTFAFTYYDAENQASYVRRKWDSETQQWGDTVLQYEFTETGKLSNHTLKSFTSGLSGTKSFFTYNENDQLVQLIVYSSNEQYIWKISFRYNYFYDANGNEIQKLKQDWDENSQEWQNGVQELSTYDASGNLIQWTRQHWDSDTEMWTNYRQELYDYDANGNQTEWVKQWVSDLDVWQSYGHEEYAYDANGNLALKIVQVFDMPSDTLVNDVKELYTYDANNNLTKLTEQEWFKGTEQWVNDTQELYSYDANGNQTKRSYQNWDEYDNEWKDNNETYYEYNENGDQTKRFKRNWNINNEKWENADQTVYVFDAHFNLTQMLRQNWDETTESWRNFTKEDYYWSEFTVNNISNDSIQEITIFPNPATEEISFYLKMPNKNSNVKIVSSSGKLCYSQKNENNTIDVRNLKPGIYYLIISNKEQNILQKFIKL